MATIVAAAGGGNWTTGATWVGGVAPTAADDASLDNTSGNVTIDAGAVCRSLICTGGTGYTGVLTHTAGVTLTIGDSGAPPTYAFRLRAGMTYTLGDPATSALSFISTNAGLQYIDTGTKTLGDITINGVGGNYSLGSAHVSNVFTLTAGAFQTAGLGITWKKLSSAGSATRTLTLSSSAITITGTGVAVDMNTTGLTMAANTAVATLTGAGAIIQTLGTLNYNGLGAVFTGGGLCVMGNGTVTFANVTYTGTAVKTNTLRLTGDLTVTGTFTVTGNSAVNRVLVSPLDPGVTKIVTAAAVSLTNVDFQDIDAAGAAIPFTGTSLGNCLGNTDITFTTPATQTHSSSAGGNWSDAGKWTSRVPLPQDDVVVDVNTTGTITVDMPRIGEDITFSGFTGTADFSSVANEVYGSVTLASGMTVSGTMGLTLAARSSKTLTSAGKQFTQAVTVAAPSGTYTLADAFSTASNFVVSAGTFSSAGFNVTCLTFAMSGASTTVSMGSGGTWSLTSTAATTVWSKTTGTLSNITGIAISSASANSRTFAGGGATYSLTYTVASSAGALVITGANTFTLLSFSDTGNARTITFPASTTTTISGTFLVNGTAGKLMTINSSSPGTQHILSKASGTVTCDYLSIFDSNATGGATWLAGANSVDN